MRSATASPMPEEAPVTRTTLSRRFFIQRLYGIGAGRMPAHLYSGCRLIYNQHMAFEIHPPLGLCAKMARLVEERGWNQDEFARNAGLHRLTVRHILHGPERRLHNATVGACARALGLSVAEL